MAMCSRLLFVFLLSLCGCTDSNTSGVKEDVTQCDDFCPKDTVRFPSILDRILKTDDGLKLTLVTKSYLPVFEVEQNDRWHPIDTSLGIINSRTAFAQYLVERCLADEDVAFQVGSLLLKLNVRLRNLATHGSLVVNLFTDNETTRKASFEFLRRRAGSDFGYKFKSNQQLMQDYPHVKDWQRLYKYHEDMKEACIQFLRWALVADKMLAREKGWTVIFPEPESLTPEMAGP